MAFSGDKKIVPVYVYSNADGVELFLNGKSLGLQFKANTLIKPVNLAAAPGCEYSASSEEGKDEVGKKKGKTNFASKAFDDRSSTRWCATDNSGNQWLQVKRQDTRPFVRSVTVHFENSIDSYSFKIQASDDGENWSDVYASKFSGKDSFVSVSVRNPLMQSRYFRVWFDELKEGRWASICEFKLSPLPPLKMPGYYAVIDKYRFRWENVPYEPGTLEAVAYKFAEPKENERNYIPKSSMFTKVDLYENLKEIGRQTVKTAGAPAALRLTLEPNPFTGKPGFRSDDDLAYILVESVDKDGTLCPLDNRTIRVTVEGSAELAGICNGDSMGMDSFTDATHPLFYGKAIVAIRSKPGSDPVRVTVESEGVEPGTVTISN